MESTSPKPIIPILPANAVRKVRRFLENRLRKLSPNAIPALIDVGLKVLSFFAFFLRCLLRLLSPSLSKISLLSARIRFICFLRLRLDTL